MHVPLSVWAAFGAFVAGVLALDLGVIHRRGHVPGLRSAALWTALWSALAIGFGAGLTRVAGPGPGLEFFTAWLLELSLSLDNVFVIALIFSAFAVPERWQHRVLFLGIVGAVLMRLGMILLGTSLVRHAEWVLYGFGALLVVAGLKMAKGHESVAAPERNPVVRWLRRVLPVTDDFHEDRFWVRIAGRWHATPLLLALACVELADLVFAVDSIPAAFSVTLDPFIVFAANVFAILGLRSLYALLSRAVQAFRHLGRALGVVLAFAGAKMLLAHTPWKIGNAVALAVVAGALVLGVGLSLLDRRRAPQPARSPDTA